MQIPKEKEYLTRYVSRLDNVLTCISVWFGLNREYFHLIIEYPNGKRYWSNIDDVQ